jgi:transposase
VVSLIFDLCSPKHPLKVHVWAGISHAGRTGISIFEGKMNAPMYTSILERSLLPFIADKMPTSHRFVQDNDPKHTSRHAQDFFEQKGINWWRTPPESPDLNPIENLWHELKEFIRREVKPKTKQQLIDGILAFWSTVDIDKCRKYIGHLNKVIPAVIEQEGNASGF